MVSIQARWAVRLSNRVGSSDLKTRLLLYMFLTVACNLEPATVFRQKLCDLEARAVCSSAPCGILPCVLPLCLFCFE